MKNKNIGCIHEDGVSQDDGYMYCPDCNESFKEGGVSTTKVDYDYNPLDEIYPQRMITELRKDRNVW